MEEVTNIFCKLSLNWVLINANFWIKDFNTFNGFYGDKYIYLKDGKRWFKKEVSKWKLETFLGV